MSARKRNKLISNILIGLNDKEIEQSKKATLSNRLAQTVVTMTKESKYAKAILAIEKAKIEERKDEYLIDSDQTLDSVLKFYYSKAWGDALNKNVVLSELLLMFSVFEKLHEKYSTISNNLNKEYRTKKTEYASRPSVELSSELFDLKYELKKAVALRNHIRMICSILSKNLFVSLGVDAKDMSNSDVGEHVDLVPAFNTTVNAFPSVKKKLNDICRKKDFTVENGAYLLLLCGAKSKPLADIVNGISEEIQKVRK